MTTLQVYSFQGIFALAAAHLEATQKDNLAISDLQRAAPEHISVVHGPDACFLQRGGIHTVFKIAKQ